MIKVLKTEVDYQAALAALERLMDLDPDPGTTEADELELLALLTREYEHREEHLPLPTPVEAIRFRMDQQGLSARDLIPYLGSRSKVSEVLSGKRTLTLSMIRALHQGLGVPLRSLLQERPADALADAPLDWARFPLKEMLARGWLDSLSGGAEAAMRRFLAPLGPKPFATVLFRRTLVRSARSMDIYALSAWTARIMIQALEALPRPPYKPGLLDRGSLRELTRLSSRPDGPRCAASFLNEHGIPLIVEPHLPRTHLDAAAVMMEPNRPVIGMTLRHDRLDNFWFCLLHEIGHLMLHLDQTDTSFYDDLDSGGGRDPREQEADAFASDTLIPPLAWNKTPARTLHSPEAAHYLARELGIHPAIVAGRMRHESRRFRILHQMVGAGEVREWFPGVVWGRGFDEDV